MLVNESTIPSLPSSSQHWHSCIQSSVLTEMHLNRRIAKGRCILSRCFLVMVRLCCWQRYESAASLIRLAYTSTQMQPVNYSCLTPIWRLTFILSFPLRNISKVTDLKCLVSLPLFSTLLLKYSGTWKLRDSPYWNLLYTKSGFHLTQKTSACHIYIFKKWNILFWMI